MKTTKLFLAAVTAGLFLLTACGGGTSDATKNAVASFDSAWSTFGTTAMAWNDSIKNCIASCETSCKSMMDECSKTCDEKGKKACDSIMKSACGKDMEVLNGMLKQMEDAKPMMDSTAAKFASFKEKVNKGEMNDADAMKQLGEFQTQLSAAQMMAADMQTKYMECKANCTKNMESCMTTCKEMMGDKKEVKK
jgi:hypothetical protein